MNTREIVSAAKQSGVLLTVDDQGHLKIKGDKAVVDRLLPDLKRHKLELIQFLKQEQAAPDEPAVVDALKPCPLCGGRSFIHGHRGGFFCTTCQPDARPGKLVLAEELGE